MFPAPTAKLPQRFALEDKTIVITGGARGLGLSFATALAEAGANIAAIDLDDSPPSEFGKLQALGVEAKYYAANVQDYDGLRNTIERIPEEFGSIDGCPGTMRTDMLKQIFEGTPGREQLLNSGSMLKRVGEPDELHGAMLYLMSDASSYMTGNDIFVNGGKL
ncbi:hypothetical protein LTR28_005643 [Elasticomyces elasticus]|nr:hypothetical protein LTR28_005643 [Elasticomyces elasticus]